MQFRRGDAGQSEPAIRIDAESAQFLHGSRCLSPGQPPIDELMQQWLDGVLSRDPAASSKLKVAIEFSLAKAGEADSTEAPPGAARDAMNCYAVRAAILRSIERAITAVRAL